MFSSKSKSFNNNINIHFYLTGDSYQILYPAIPLCLNHWYLATKYILRQKGRLYVIRVVKLCMRSAKPITATSALEGQGCYLGVCLELPQHCHWGGRALRPQWPGSSGTLHPRSQINPSVWCSWPWKWTAPPPPSDPTCTHHTHTR